MLLSWKPGERTACLDYHGSLAGFAFPEHRHHGAWELTVVLSGTLHHTVNGVRLEQPPGTATLVREGDRHGLEGTHLEFANLSFASAYIDGLARTPCRPDDAIATALASADPLWCRIPDVECGRLKADLDGLDVGIGGPEEGVRLLAILVRVLLGCHEQARSRHREPPPWMARLRALLGDPARPVPDLAGLRRLAGVSPEHVARTCRRHLGMSPSEFLNRCRVQRAAAMLKADPGRPVGAIASEAGFASLGYFARCFRRAYGTSPQIWRERQSGTDLREVDPWLVVDAEAGSPGQPVRGS